MLIETEWIIRLLFLGLLHWSLAGIMLQDLAKRQKVAGGRKWVWAVLIIFLTFLGSLIYLLFHPQVLSREE